MADVDEGRGQERSFGDNGRKDGSRGERGGRDARNRDGQGGSRGGGSRRGEGRGRDGERRRDGGRNGRRGDARRGEGRGRDGDRRRGRGGVRHDRSNPRREGFREDRMAQKEQEPDLPQGLEISDLDPSVLQDLKVLSKDNLSLIHI